MLACRNLAKMVGCLLLGIVVDLVGFPYSLHYYCFPHPHRTKSSALLIPMTIEITFPPVAQNSGRLVTKSAFLFKTTKVHIPEFLYRL
jgi:hypothetical protein